MSTPMLMSIYLDGCVGAFLLIALLLTLAKEKEVNFANVVFVVGITALSWFGVFLIVLFLYFPWEWAYRVWRRHHKGRADNHDN